MTVSTTTLTRAAGLAAAVAGLIFILVQINHPPMDVSSVTTTEWAVRNTMKVVMAALALAGITGMYLRQVKQIGVLGLVGYLLFASGYLVITAIAFVAAYVLPSLADIAPGYVNDLLIVADGAKTPHGDVGLMQTAVLIEGATYLSGGLVFGIALFRARVLARWAAALLALGTLATIALPVLPHVLHRGFAVPTGVALIGLGISLWRTTHVGGTETTINASATTASAPTASATTVSARPERATVR
jgi:hypothetical protein